MDNETAEKCTSALGNDIKELSDLLDNRLSEIHNELKGIERALWRIAEEIHNKRG